MSRFRRFGGGGPQKYKNKITYIDGICFRSKKEAEHYRVLKSQHEAGHIHILKCHPSWVLTVNGVFIAKYFADFSYVRNGMFVVVDVKGKVEALYLMKKRLLKALYGIEVQEV